MVEENVVEKSPKAKYVPGTKFYEYASHFTDLTIPNKNNELKLLQKILRKDLIEEEKLKFKERLKSIKG